MALVTNTITRYDAAKSVNEELSSVIYSISPIDTPYMSNSARENVKNTFFEWQTDALAAASGSNAALEGDEATVENRAPTSRVGNYTQISRKVIGVTGTVEAVDKAGMKSYLSFELAKASAELKRDMETTLTSNQAAVVGNNTTARKTAGLGAWLRTNSFKGAGAGAAAPVMSGAASSNPDDGYPTTAAVAGTARPFTETLLKTAIQSVWAEGGDPKMLMVGPYNKTVASTFTGIAAARFNTSDAEPISIIGTADVYLSDFGKVRIVANRFQPAGNAYLLDPDKSSVAFLRNFRTEVLAKTGDSEKRMVLCEYGLKCRTEKGLGVIRDLTTAA